MLETETLLDSATPTGRLSDEERPKDEQGHNLYPELGDETLRGVFETWLQRRKGYQHGQCCFECWIEIMAPWYRIGYDR